MTDPLSHTTEYTYDGVGNRTAMTATLRVAATTPLNGTLVTTHTYDIANRLTGRTVSDGRSYTYDWSDRGQLLAEWTQGYPVRPFTTMGQGGRWQTAAGRPPAPV